MEDSGSSGATASSDSAPVHGPERQPGELIFAALMLFGSIVLLSLIGEETRWFRNVALPLQPRFWPAVILTSLTLFSALYLIFNIRAYRRHRHGDLLLRSLREIAEWIRPIEFAIYFIAYAAVVPWLGYLLSTMIFMPLLGLRSGYRSSKILGGLALIGAVVVLFFKTGLAVKMPAGAIYDALPDPLRNFFLINF